MDEIEVPLENVQEHLHHAAHEASGGHGGGPSWIMASALLSAILAVAAAIAALKAGHYANEAMIEQIQSSDHWSHYQAKAIKAAVTESRRDILSTAGKDVAEMDAKLEKYKQDQEELQEQATEKEKESQGHLVQHETLAKAVTLFQIAIAITAIAVLVRKRLFLLVSLVFGVGGIFFLLQGLFQNH